MASNPEPLAIIAGDTLRWRKTISSFVIDDKTTVNPVGDSYALTYELRGPAAITITTTTDAGDYVVNVAKTTTAAWGAGTYFWHAYLSKGSERYLADHGQIEIKADLATITTSYDGRSHAKKMLDAIEAVLENRASSEVSSYSIAGRTISTIPHAELIRHRDRYRAEYENEQIAARVANGLHSKRNIFVRFG